MTRRSHRHIFAATFTAIAGLFGATGVAAAQRVLVVDLDRDLLQASDLSLAEVGDAIAASGSSPRTVRSLAAVRVVLGSNGPVPLGRVARVTSGSSRHGFTHVVRIQAARRESAVDVALRVARQLSDGSALRIVGLRTVVQLDLDRAAAALVDTAVAEQTMRRALETEHVSPSAPEVLFRTTPLSARDVRSIGIPARDGTLVPASEVMTFEDGTSQLAPTGAASGDAVVFVLVSGVAPSWLRLIPRSVGSEARVMATQTRSLRVADRALLDRALEAAGAHGIVIGPARHTGWRRPSASAGLGAPGRVVLMTPGGWANVYDESGRFLGQTPLRLSMPAGAHELWIRPYGEAPARRVAINVQSGQQARVVQPVDPQ